MTWQDELQKLDTELASGRISADDYRRRRDEVLAASSGGAAPQAQQQGPFAPPFRWTATPPSQQPNPDATQVVNTQGTPPNPDATQVVNTQRSDADRTQFVQPVSGPIPMQQPPQQWGQQGAGNPPPWGSHDGFGPISDPNPGWVAQGPEVFDESGGGKGRIFAIIGVVLVLALIGGGIWWFASGNGGGADPGQTTAASTPASTTKPKPTDPMEILLEEIPEPVGKEDQKGAIAEVAKLAGLEPGEIEILTTAGVEKVPYRTAAKKPDSDGPGPDKFSVMVFPTDSEADAAQLVETLKAYQDSNGLIHIKEPLPGMPVSLIFEKKIGPEAALYRGLWASGKNVIRVNIDQTPLVNEAALSGSYQRQVQAMLKVFPAAQ